jgi:hypothetical protein
MYRNRDQYAEITVKFSDGGEYVNVGTYTSVLANALNLADSTAIVSDIGIKPISESTYDKRRKELVNAQMDRLAQSAANRMNKDK